LAIHSARAYCGEIEILYSIKQNLTSSSPGIQTVHTTAASPPYREAKAASSTAHHLFLSILPVEGIPIRPSKSELLHWGAALRTFATKASCRVHRRFNYLLRYCTVRQEEVKSENCMFGSWSVTSIRLDRCIAPALHAGSSCSSFSHRFRNPPHFDRGVRVLCQASLRNSLDRPDQKTEILLANEVA
jgi:hypothetical protein